MKRIALSFGCLLLVVSDLSAQGTVNFANVGAGLSGLHVTNLVTGARAAAGPEFWVQLYYGNGMVTDQNLLVPVPDAPIHFSAPGIFTGGERVLPAITPSGGIGTFQVRVWSSVLGDSYEEAWANWLNQPFSEVCFGVSNLFPVDTADPTIVPRPTPVNLVGLRPFVICIPEPSIIALGLFGLGVLHFFRRRGA